MKRIWFAAAILCFGATVTGATATQESRQELLLRKKREKAKELSAWEISNTEARVLGLERVRFPRNVLERGFHGIRPLIGGMPSGSGFVAGVGYLREPDFGLVKLEVNARHSTRGFTEVDAELVFPSPRLERAVRARLNTAHQDYTSLRFFGIGNGSDVEDLTYFGQKNTLFGAGVTAELGGALELTGDFDRLRVEVDGGDRAPSLARAFEPAFVPGFSSVDHDFNVYRAGATWSLRDDLIPSAGVVLSAEGARYHEQDLGRFDFTRITGEVKAYLPLGYRNRLLALRLRTSHSTADGDGRIPFYLMETLGGARTIRGYREYRFRDTRNLLVNVEYRWEVWTYVDFALFFDAGKVFSELSETDFTGFHTGYGFGIRAHGPGGTLFRVDLARSREGYSLHVGAGPSF